MNRVDSEDYDALRDLLRSWDLIEILPHLIKHEINIKELYLIRRHHLDEFLKNFSIGIRIRFEHHLSEWIAMIQANRKRSMKAERKQERRRHLEVNSTEPKKPRSEYQVNRQYSPQRQEQANQCPEVNGQYSPQRQDQANQRLEGLGEENYDDDVVIIETKEEIHIIEDDDEEEEVRDRYEDRDKDTDEDREKNEDSEAKKRDAEDEEDEFDSDFD
ncbi:hypothetical protein KR074_004780 [Drosophila pseudoananassae]|nr:hypothetical protein KR074_004780 [Drosophila pseudoananassae]